MSSLTIRDAASGKPRIIQNPLLPEHIQVGRTLWYDGFTSVGRWDCPAVITRVNKKKKQFKVRSLDDMKEQSEWYNFSPERQSSHSRSTMRLTSAEKVNEYLRQQRVSLGSAVARAKSQYESAVTALRYFDEIRSSLTF